MNERQTKIANRADKLQEDLQSIINVVKKVKGSEVCVCAGRWRSNES